MQHRTDSKSRLAQYGSVKEPVAHKEVPKKSHTKNQNKIINKSKNTKPHTKSQSKIKTVNNKLPRVNENFNSLNLATDAPIKLKTQRYDA